MTVHSLKTLLPIAVVLTVGASDFAHAQSFEEQAKRNYRQGLIRIYEDVLFGITKKTSNIIYAKQYGEGSDVQLICGEALFGSKRQTFFLNMGTKAFLAGATKAQLKKEGCDADGGEVLIDMR